MRAECAAPAAQDSPPRLRRTLPLLFARKFLNRNLS
jgi:hypothetical protein